MSHVLAFMTKLIGEYPVILSCSGCEYAPDAQSFQRDFKRWSLSVRQVLEHAGLETFLSEWVTIVSDGGDPSWKLPLLGGILESARECFESGLTGKFRHLLHAEMFDSLVAQAKELLQTGHKIPAAVLCRIVIERWLRDQGDKAAVPNWETAKASSVNDGLRNAGVFSTPKWRQVQSLLDVGNAAAHGSESEFIGADVGRMIDFAESNCV